MARCISAVLDLLCMTACQALLQVCSTACIVALPFCCWAMLMMEACPACQASSGFTRGCCKPVAQLVHKSAQLQHSCVRARCHQHHLLISHSHIRFGGCVQDSMLSPSSGALQGWKWLSPAASSAGPASSLPGLPVLLGLAWLQGRGTERPWSPEGRQAARACRQGSTSAWPFSLQGHAQL